jgi:hypothetical protein
MKRCIVKAAPLFLVLSMATVTLAAIPDSDSWLTEPEGLDADSTETQPSELPELEADFIEAESSELPELYVESKRSKFLHILAYVREYSMLNTYSDTISLFREKMVDYMLPPEKKSKFKGWSIPRILKAASYYRFTDADGLDSVSDRNPHHFSWSDWINIPALTPIPENLHGMTAATDTLFGKYSPTETWIRRNDHVSVAVNVLADTMSQKWAPDLSAFFHRNLEFDNFKLQYDYNNVLKDSVTPEDLTHFSFIIESTGRGHEMFRFNRRDEDAFVTTTADVFIIDREYITLKEAKKWGKHDFSNDDLDIFVPAEAPLLTDDILNLIARVDGIDEDSLKLATAPDGKIRGNDRPNRSYRIGNRLLLMLKGATGISRYKYNKMMKNVWKKYRLDRKQETIRKK